MQTAVCFIRTTLLVAFLGYTGCSGRHSSPALAKILAVEESSTGDASDARDGRSPQTGQLLSTGEIVRLRRGEKATVAFTPGIIATLFNQAEVGITKFRLAKDGNETGSDLTERDVAIRISKGSLIGSVAPEALKTSFVITAGLADLSFEPDSLFYLEISGEEFHLTCVRGTVRLSHDGSQVATLPPGNWLHWPKSQPNPSDPEPAAANARAQLEITSTLEAEAVMQLLVVAEQKAVPGWRHPSK